MLKDASVNPVLKNSWKEENTFGYANVNQTAESSQFSANTYAERLMDDLFQDIEHLLDMKSSPNSNDSQPNVSSEAPTGSDQPAPKVDTDVSHLALPLARIEALSIPAAVLAQNDRALAEVTEHPVVVDPVVAKEGHPRKRVYTRLWLAGGCLSIVISLALYLLYQEGRFRHQAGNSAAVTATTTAIAEPANPFADYAQKALRNIDQNAQQTNGSTPTPVENAGNPGVPTVVIPRTNAPSPLTPNRTTAGSERVYVPVYQIPSNLYPPGTGVAPLPNLGTSKGASKSKPKPSIAKAPNVSRKLVGVLDQGERSVALFETNGITQRYEIGESISSSGWTLVEVTKDQAIIRRNGEVRSLFVGHSFQ